MANPYYDRDRRFRNPGGDDNFSTTHVTVGTMNHAYSHHSNANEYLSSGVPFVYTSAAIDNSTAVVIEKTCLLYTSPSPRD